MRRFPALLGCEEAAALLGKPGVVFLDASWHMPWAARDAHAEYVAAHIPGAVFFDPDAVSDQASPLPHMLPTAQAFGGAMGELGIGNGTQVIAYDTTGLFSAARAWWMFKVFGHEQVSVLDGGLPQWRKAGKPTESGEARLPRKTFAAAKRLPLIAGLAQMQDNLRTHEALVLDARSPARFSGREPEPRPGMRGGHIPGSVNMHYQRFLNADGTFLQPEALQQLFAEAGLKPGRPALCTCGSGVTACIIALGLYQAGHTPWAVYDGSWAEWGAGGEDAASRPVASA